MHTQFPGNLLPFALTKSNAAGRIGPEIPNPKPETANPKEASIIKFQCEHVLRQLRVLGFGYSLALGTWVLMLPLRQQRQVLGASAATAAARLALCSRFDNFDGHFRPIPRCPRTNTPARNAGRILKHFNQCEMNHSGNAPRSCAECASGVMERLNGSWARVPE